MTECDCCDCSARRQDVEEGRDRERERIKRIIEAMRASMVAAPGMEKYNHIEWWAAGVRDFHKAISHAIDEEETT